jgi:putative DNA primase/helicase
MTRVNFPVLAAAALQQVNTLLAEWLPGGHREGHEWKALNPTRADSRVGSFSVNLDTGAWADFATGDKGGDLIALAA